MFCRIPTKLYESTISDLDLINLINLPLSNLTNTPAMHYSKSTETVSNEQSPARAPPHIKELHNRDVNFTLICCILCFSISALNYGFDVQTFAAAQAMTPFEKEFGVRNPKTHKFELEPWYLSLLNSLHAPAQIIGLWLGSFISSRFGRRMVIFTMSLYAIVSTSVVFSSTTKAQLLTGRTAHYVYLGMELSVLPVVLAEMAPVRWRSLMVGLYWFNVKLGGLILSLITRRTSKWHTNLSWKLPTALFYAVPAIVAGTIWFLPESPRWLLSRNRRREAFTSLRRIRNERTTDDVVHAELDELQILITKQAPEGRFIEIFRAPHLKRTTVVIMANFFQQATGQAFASQYGTLFVKSLNSINPFSFNVGNNAVSLGALLICLILSDQFGRRLFILLSSLLQIAAFFIMGGLGTSIEPSRHFRDGIAAMGLVYSFGFSIGWAPLTYLVSTELPAPRKREHTLRVAFSIKLLMEFTVSFTYPYLESKRYAGLGGRLGFIYGSFAVLSLIFGYFCFPETKGLAIEEIDLQLTTEITARNLDVEAAHMDECRSSLSEHEIGVTIPKS